MQLITLYVRSRSAAKYGGHAHPLTFDDAASCLQRSAVNVAALDKALAALPELDTQLRRIVENRLFAGLTIENTSEVPGIRPATIKRDWVTIRAWLSGAMTGEAPA